MSRRSREASVAMYIQCWPLPSCGISLSSQPFVVFLKMMLFDRPRALLLVIFFFAAFVAPSLAQAHDGRAHFTPTATTVDSILPLQVMSELPGTKAASTVTAVTTVDIITRDRSALGSTGCDGNCCGGAAGMSCCGAALAALPCAVPVFHLSVLFLIQQEHSLRELPPETLPEPPKSFA